ncbi:Ventricular zone-expressed PH domain-containing protein-like 1 [Mizuhopecten yessoensis]|uniref:Ventricular zone-expressed PH domain-containing protein-like 1 n=1 Tax=Mizuhopecten yessoensis TaxID=6573 RepID=A0A210PTR8_MIZYE|nr:Ventricular zone-expressed PH domain-containing protein-like 1 [Mizuhopecten yessoensis]
MHELFAFVLRNKDLSKAGDLFSLDDRDIKRCLISVLQKIGEILDNKDFASNDNDQRVVDICVARVTTAIRKTESIEKHAVALVRLLELCQKHNLNPSSQEEDPPHAKIASDIMAFLFMHYDKGKVMILAIPVVVNFLCCNNKELGRNVSSYLSLAALDNADLLAPHVDLILSSLLRGNYFLSTLLPQIFTQCRQAVIDQTDCLVKIIDKCELSQRLNLFQVFGMIAKTDTKVLEKYVRKFVKYLSSNTLSPMILCLFVDMATASPLIFVDHVSTLQKVAKQQPTHIVQVMQIMGALVTIHKDYARKSMDYFVSQFGSADQTALTVILQEIKALSLNNHDLLDLNLEEISKLSRNGSSAVRILVQQLKEDNSKYSSAAPMENTKQERWALSQTKESSTNGKTHMRVPAAGFLQPRSIDISSILLMRRQIFGDPELENPQTLVNDQNFLCAVIRRAVIETGIRSVKGHNFHELMLKIKELVLNINDEDKEVMKKLKEKATNVIHYLKKRQVSPDREFKKRKLDYGKFSTDDDKEEKLQTCYKTGSLVTLLDYKDVPIAKANIVAYPCTDLCELFKCYLI